jgi:hypothetical protein
LLHCILVFQTLDFGFAEIVLKKVSSQNP